MKVLNLTLIFSKKYIRPADYFSLWCLRNSQKLLTTNQFLVSHYFLQSWIFLFFNLRFDLCSIIAKGVNKIRNNTVCVTIQATSSPYFRILLCNRYGSLLCISTYFCKLKEIGVYRPYFQAMSSVKSSDPGHFLKAQGNSFSHFHVPFFYIFLTPKNYKLSF